MSSAGYTGFGDRVPRDDTRDAGSSAPVREATWILQSHA